MIGLIDDKENLVNKVLKIQQVTKKYQKMQKQREYEMECETCDGKGTIDETLGGEPFSNQYEECPDCRGKGYLLLKSSTRTLFSSNSTDNTF
jgi:DnaJ-class molecular chaperone